MAHLDMFWRKKNTVQPTPPKSEPAKEKTPQDLDCWGHAMLCALKIAREMYLISTPPTFARWLEEEITRRKTEVDFDKLACGKPDKQRGAED